MPIKGVAQFRDGRLAGVERFAGREILPGGIGVLGRKLFLPTKRIAAGNFAKHFRRRGRLVVAQFGN